MNRCRMCGEAFDYLRSDEVGPACRDCALLSAEFWGQHEKMRQRYDVLTEHACGAVVNRDAHMIHHLICCDVRCRAEWLAYDTARRAMLAAYEAGRKEVSE